MADQTNERRHHVIKRLEVPFIPDADWDRPEWRGVAEVRVDQFMGPKPGFVPVVRAKIMYHPEWIYVIFRVEDQFLRAIESRINGRVWEDSCVEFFFSPDPSNPSAYFNLEVNCAGIPLFHFKDPARPGAPLPSEADIRRIEIAHSVPGLVDPEITEPTTWTIGYRIPVAMLSTYGVVQTPGPGVKWGANFYKIGDKTSNPHWMTWSFIDHPVPNFHLPLQFGSVTFE
ncbi:MAG: carbohydrate-binding family 9-like protein [Bacteroidota bacterium]